ncbi:MAG TPA: LysE family translocator [Bacteroidales bacterium]|nr:LysE family translocator [Bacteroidales bacterium]HPS46219.1 LysE family translocator [Bacteroidales bacterium]HQH18357.1 LysE family translocator [Bacteroidales bacterium]HQI45736.1 LysE family translocator [Bacteroidales bacterium]
MFRVFFEGVLWGLLVSITIGPAFFSIIQTGIDRGFKSAFYTSLGVMLCDAFIIVICYLGLTSLFQKPENNIYIGFVGGIILIIYGTYSYLKKPDILKRRSPKYKTPPINTKQIKYVIKGFLLNIANPFIIIFWLTAVGFVSARTEEGKLINYAIVFFSGTLLTIFGTDLLKSFIGNKIKKYLRPRILLIINKIVGITLIIFGIVLMIRVIQEF